MYLLIGIYKAYLINIRITVLLHPIIEIGFYPVFSRNIPQAGKTRYFQKRGFLSF